jgi:sugar transferase (PEP-CTERM system associated)
VSERLTLRRLLLPGLDMTGLGAAFLVAVYLRFGQSVSEMLAYEGLTTKAVANMVIIVLCLYYSGYYEEWPAQRPLDTATRGVQALVAGTLLLLTVYYAVPNLRVGRGILVLYLPLSLVFLLSARAVYRWMGEDEAFAQNTLILGTSVTAQEVARQMIRQRFAGLRIVGFLSDDPNDVGIRIGDTAVVGTTEELTLIARRHRVDRIVVALDDRRGRMPVEELFRCRIEGIKVEEAASVLERLTGQIPLKNLRPSLLVFSSGFNESRLQRRLKNASEQALATVMLLALAPVMLILALAVRLSSPGPALYGQERVGEQGRVFRVLKFRTMRPDAESGTGPIWASAEGDPRVTRLGRLLRKTRLDELPQLINVLRSEMSFVGPRPERPHFVEELRKVLPFYDERHSVRPGITGWAQVRSGYGSSIEDAQLKLQFDLFYIKHLSFALDLTIVLDTLKVVVVGRGAR